MAKISKSPQNAKFRQKTGHREPAQKVTGEQGEKWSPGLDFQLSEAQNPTFYPSPSLKFQFLNLVGCYK